MDAAVEPELFISYAHEDESAFGQLQTTLKTLSPSLRFRCFSDKGIHTGDDWLAQIKAAMERAQLAILLVSRNFLASSFIRDVELPRLIQRAQAGDLQLFPIPVRPADWTPHQLGRFQAAWNPEQPLSDLSETGQDAAWVQIGQALTAALQTPKSRPSSLSNSLPQAELFVGRQEQLAALEKGLLGDPSVQVVMHRRGWF